VYVAATKASPATEEPMKRTATKVAPAKRTAAAKTAAPAKRATKATAATATPETDGDASAKAPAKRATKAAAKAKPNGVAPRTRAKKGAPAEDGAITDNAITAEDDLNTGIEDLETEPADLEDDADLVVEDLADL
jgi:RNA polymerase primary sigma factor